MKLVVGLGNPGPEYVWSRHNAGWIALDGILQRLGAGKPKLRFEASFWEGLPYEGERCSFLKPLTYMNRSGLSVREAVRYFDLPPSSVLIVYDDVSLPFGKIRLREQGSAGGQKGMVSILGALGTLEVPRLRIGIGEPPPQNAPEGPKRELAPWVLGTFGRRDRDLWDPLLDRCHEAFRLWLTLGFPQAMSRVNDPAFCNLPSTPGRTP